MGGGIGGLCLAHGLRKAGISVEVYERDRNQSARLDRYRLHINPAGSRALHACLPAPAWEAFVTTAGKPGGGFGFLTEQLKNLVVVEESIMYPESEDPSERAYPVDRATLRQVLLAGLDDVTHFGKAVASYGPSSDGRISAFFTDGSVATGDVLVGADGANSQVRKQYLPQSRRVDTGAVGVGLKLYLTDQNRTWLPARLAVGENIVVPAEPAFLFTSVFEHTDAYQASGDYLLCAFVAAHDACRSGMGDLDGAGLQRAVGEMIKGWHPGLRRTIAECDPESVGIYSFEAAASIPPWRSTNVVLLGDAVHSMPPTGGLGANTALRDASLLASQLGAASRGECSLLAAIADYEMEMRDYGFAAVDSSLRSLRQGLMKNPLAIAGMRAWFRLSNAIPPLRRVGFRDNWAKDCRSRAWERRS
jgi:2-polyprenyl-6-methoxyphenol hydroxylase-like FAD-dependent oxidoreductase